MRTRKDIEKDSLIFETEINRVTNEILLDIRDLLLKKCVKLNDKFALSTLSAPPETKSELKGENK